MTDGENTGRCIVALPTATEPVHHIGDVSEPKHMTLVWLGKPEDNPNLDMDQVKGQVEGVAGNYAQPIECPVESLGQLGDDNATVLFQRSDGMDELRNDLLAQSYIKDGFGAVEQFPQWTPHTTLGYDLPPEDLLTQDDIPEQIIYDRLGVWDGDEHTEYPLGPSAESTLPEGPEEGIVDTLEAGLLMIPETMAHTVLSFGDVARLPVHDAESLASACRAADQIPEGLSRTFTQRRLTKRARELSCQHVIPTDWLRQAAQRTPSSSPAVPPPNVSDVSSSFDIKTELSGISDTALRAAYVRGVREFTMTASSSRPPIPRDVVAQARVNSLIRLSQGDLSARTDDKDLLS